MEEASGLYKTSTGLLKQSSQLHTGRHVEYKQDSYWHHLFWGLEVVNMSEHKTVKKKYVMMRTFSKLQRLERKIILLCNVEKVLHHYRTFAAIPVKSGCKVEYVHDLKMC